MLLISNQTTQAGYVPALSFGPDEFDYISYSVWNQTVAAQAFDLSSTGAWQLGDWGTEVLLPPSSGIIQKTGGVRFRTNPATPAAPGIVSAWGIKSGGAQWLGSVQLTGTLASSGGFTPPATSVSITSQTNAVAPVNITAVTAATANTIVTAPAFTFDGVTPYDFDFYCAYTDNPNVANGIVAFLLFEDGANLALISSGTQLQSARVGGGLNRIRFIPTALSHVYSVRAFVNGGTGIVAAGTGLAGGDAPAFLRITQAS